MAMVWRLRIYRKVEILCGANLEGSVLLLLLVLFGAATVFVGNSAVGVQNVTKFATQDTVDSKQYSSVHSTVQCTVQFSAQYSIDHRTQCNVHIIHYSDYSLYSQLYSKGFQVAPPQYIRYFVLHIACSKQNILLVCRTSFSLVTLSYAGHFCFVLFSILSVFERW